MRNPVLQISFYVVSGLMIVKQECELRLYINIYLTALSIHELFYKT